MLEEENKLKAEVSNNESVKNEHTLKLQKIIITLFPFMIILFCAITIWQTINISNLKQGIEETENYQIVQAVVVGYRYNGDSVKLIVENDSKQRTTVDVLLEETKTSVKTSIELGVIMGRRVAYLSRKDTHILLTIFLM